VSGDWNLTWRDEFTGDTLNPVWHAAQYWDSVYTVVGGGELLVYDRSGVSVSDGMLHLTAREEASHGMDYVSGLVQTGGYDGTSGEPRFNFLYGYMEVRAKLPSGQGIWPAIWMMPASYNDGNGELDVLEVIGSESNVANFSLHRNGAHNTDTWTGPDFSDGFHTYGVDWQPDHVAWYVDGVERGRMTDPALICPEAMYPILNVAVGGDWAGAPDETTPFPASIKLGPVTTLTSWPAVSTSLPLPVLTDRPPRMSEKTRDTVSSPLPVDTLSPPLRTVTSARATVSLPLPVSTDNALRVKGRNAGVTAPSRTTSLPLPSEMLKFEPLLPTTGSVTVAARLIVVPAPPLIV
jgi:hypothetical protein